MPYKKEYFFNFYNFYWNIKDFVIACPGGIDLAVIYLTELKKGGSKMDYLLLLNVIFCVTIVVLAFKRYMQSGVKAFMFLGIAYILFGFSHLTQLIGLGPELKTILIGVRAGGYITLIAGLFL